MGFTMEKHAHLLLITKPSLQVSALSRTLREKTSLPVSIHNLANPLDSMPAELTLMLFDLSEMDNKEIKKDNTFTIIGDNGEEIKCEILFTYEDEKTKKNYMAYTDNSLDDEGNTKVYASIFNPEEENPVLLPIETDEEWKLIEGILTSLSSSDEKEEA